MTTILKSGGLQHAYSLGNIDTTSKHSHFSSRSYDSEDENVSRRRNPSALYPKPSVYSKADIQEQYCLSERQLNTIEAPRRDGFFGCWSNRSNNESFLSVCVGRRHPSDENLADYAPFHKYPKYSRSNRNIIQSEDEIENFHFRRRPTSFLCNTDPKRFTWMTAAEQDMAAANADGLRGYRCPSHVGISTSTTPAASVPAPRTKHVSFARSHTLTSFEDLTVERPVSRLSATKSHERLIGGKKARSSIIQDSSSIHATAHHPYIGHEKVHFQDSIDSQISLSSSVKSKSDADFIMEKIKRNVKKTQATQTDCFAGRRLSSFSSNLSSSPGSRLCINGNVVVGRKLTKSYSEALTRKIHDEPSINMFTSYINHDMLQRTQSEEPPRSPRSQYEQQQQRSSIFNQFETYEQHASELGTSKSSEIFVSEYHHRQTHSRNLSGTTDRSIDSKDLAAIQSNNNFIDSDYVNTSGCIEFMERATQLHSNSNSLPRRKCLYHANEYHTNSLPRQSGHQTYSNQQTEANGDGDNGEDDDDENDDDGIERAQRIKANLAQFRVHGTFSLDSSGSGEMSSKRRYSCAIPEVMRHLTPSDFEELQAVVRRNSMNVFYQRPSNDADDDEDEDEDDDDDQDQEEESYYDEEGDIDEQSQTDDDDEYCSTCESDSDDDSKHEKEIFIDFKPSVAPLRNAFAQGNATRLQKTMSEGEIMFEKRRSEINHNDIPMVSSTSEEEFKVPDNDNIGGKERYTYSAFPIKDESICEKKQFLKLPKNGKLIDVGGGKIRREIFRKRSTSLEQSQFDESETGSGGENRLGGDGAGDSKLTSPIKNISAFASSDSLANDLTRDHSDGGNWNESQVTVLQVDPSVSDGSKTLLTPSEKRKNLILQHQQRSSMDTEAIEIGDHLYDQSHVQLRPSPIPTTQSPRKSSSDMLRKHSMPSIAVTPSTTLEEDVESNDENVMAFTRPTIRFSPQQNTSERRRKSADPIEPIYSNISTELQRIAKSSSDQQPFVHHTETRRSTAADISECSTNTEDYVTCTDASKRGINTATSTTTTTTHKSATAQSSQTLTQNGSSFESASSIYSLARVDNICEDAPTTNIEDTLALAPPPPIKPSPSHSISSSSSGSYFNGKKAMKSTSSPRSSIAMQATTSAAAAASAGTSSSPPPSSSKMNTESVSDDEKSEKRYSSSGYYESPHDDEPCRMRKQRDWAEDDRRRRKEKMRLDIEKENAKSITSPTKKPICFKRISPDDRAALHILDGTSTTKTKRIRPKTRRSPRTRNPNEDPFTRKVKLPSTSATTATTTAAAVAPGSEHMVCDKPEIRHPPSKYAQQSALSLSPSHSKLSPKKRVSPSSEKRLKALSTESLRSVSPGSDSVFYSEVDVHCHHCGKEVEIVAALDDTESHALAQDEDVSANIVKPPADFADSPDGQRQPIQRIYKKLDRRLRSEERGDRRHYRSRQDSARAKSEERGKDETKEQSMRAAGSSPCVGADSSFNVRCNVADPEQGIYHGVYRVGMWICITDRDVWHRNDFPFNDDRPKDLSDRRPSTESEKDFRKKYQAITHRLVHRKSCVEMYRRQTSNSFNTDKTIIVRRESGEFGFRIHGSKPVVVSAIEPETPAESSGLEIGDIVLSVNGVSVIDKSHSEVVKIAHAGSDILELEVARTFGVLSNEVAEVPNAFLYSGYLWRQGHDNQTGGKKWVRRWFALRPDHCLYYYKSEQESQPVGAILLTNHTVESCSADIGRPFAFRISLPECVPEGVLYLAADTEEASNRWIAVTSHASKQSDPWLEMSTRNLRLPPNSIPRPDCYGYLLKLGNRWRTWSKRYCVLKDACLYFYLDGSSKNALGMACLQGYRVQISNNAVGKKYAFEISPPEPKLRHYCFSTDSDMDKKRWVAALEYSIDRWMKAS